MKRFKSADILFATISLVLIFLSINALRGENLSEPRAVVKVKDTEYIYPLSVPKTLTFRGELGEAVIIIENNSIHFQNSPCRDKICIHMGEAHKHGDFLACLPNRIIVTIEGGTLESGNQ